MQSRLRETTYQLMKALEAFYPFVKNAEEQISMLESDLLNKSDRSKKLDSEIAEKIKTSDALLAADKKKTKDKLDQAELLLQNAQEIYFELYKAKVTRIIPPAEYGDKLSAKAAEVSSKVKKAREGVEV